MLSAAKSASVVYWLVPWVDIDKLSQGEGPTAQITSSEPI